MGDKLEQLGDIKNNWSKNIDPEMKQALAFIDYNT